MPLSAHRRSLEYHSLMSTVSQMTLLDVSGLPNDTLFYVDGFPTLFGTIGTGSGL